MPESNKKNQSEVQFDEKVSSVETEAKRSGPTIVYARPFRYKKNKEHGVMIYITKDFRDQVEPFIDKLCRLEIKLAE